MLFNSGLFLKFFAAFLLLYFLVRNSLTARNWLIIAASYTFYAAWDWRFLSLLIISSLVDFAVGLALVRAERTPIRRWLLTASMVANLGILGFFKYYGFFVDSFIRLLNAAGLHFETSTLHIVLPVGISFYTFQTMSYTIDVFRRKIPPCQNLSHFLAYVSFFPQLVAGPIERASHLLPQFARTLVITTPMIRQGLWLCLWGMFKKVVIADNLAPLVEMAFDHPSPGALLVLLGAAAFALQIYGDFSGYSDIARGTALLLGFDLMLNFNLPYFAANIRDFWARWHISLSTWLRDYLYIPLGGNRRGELRTYFNLMLTMLLGGLWHGAKWTFVAWGAWHGLALALHRLWFVRRKTASPRWTFPGWLATLLVVIYGWILFRAESLSHVLLLTTQLTQWHLPPWITHYALAFAAFSLPLLLMQLWQWRARNLLAPLALRDRWLVLLEGILLIAIITWWEKDKVPFIYFQF